MYHNIYHIKTLHSAYTVYLFVLYGSHNKQRCDAVSFGIGTDVSEEPAAAIFMVGE
jgi:hypothetical protein